MADPERVREAMRELGRSLAAFRRAAGLSQFALAVDVHYTRSTVANVEVGRQNAPKDFWVRCDHVLGAGGTLNDGYDVLYMLRIAHREEEARNTRPPMLGRMTPARDHVPDGTIAGLALSGLSTVDLLRMISAGTFGAAQWTSVNAAPDWEADTLVSLTDLGRVDLDVERRSVLGAATYSVRCWRCPGNSGGLGWSSWGEAARQGMPAMLAEATSRPFGIWSRSFPELISGEVAVMRATLWSIT